MKLETKYDLGQEVYYVKDEYTIEKGEVLTIYFGGTFKNIQKYEIEYKGNVFCEDDIFLTEEEAKRKAQSYIRR